MRFPREAIVMRSARKITRFLSAKVHHYYPYRILLCNHAVKVIHHRPRAAPCPRCLRLLHPHHRLGMELGRGRGLELAGRMLDTGINFLIFLFLQSWRTSAQPMHQSNL